ncbi:manganese efflux pump MntP [Halomonas sp. HP20-15]|uniref:manganese efflux pump MntP n=1 Tax=Halomonas sp. HP20-15 TaxID=3085901 RepID=UPI0029810B04|nr:manganese efflux pump MntP [Halomonas sp. HP20-15]MDW5377476.1 manganese efflux pump MntP [Halomonas sp. HP20-15]
MTLASTVFLAFAMSTDAFAAAIGKGAALERPHFREALRTGLIFGLIEGGTPLIGWSMGLAASRYVADWDHWIAFALLLVLGGHMIKEGLSPSAEHVEKPSKPTRHSFLRLAVTALATSIDALVVGISLAFVDVNIVPTALMIGLATLVMVTCGVMLGRVLGRMIGQRAEIVGGMALIGIGTVLLCEHLGVLA